MNDPGGRRHFDLSMKTDRTVDHGLRCWLIIHIGRAPHGAYDE
jgi:hypothetical protein